MWVFFNSSPFIQEAMRAVLIFTQTENQKITIDQLVGESNQGASTIQ